MRKLLLLTLFFICGFAANSQAQIVTATTLDLNIIEEKPAEMPIRFNENHITFIATGDFPEIMYSRLIVRNKNRNMISGIYGFGISEALAEECGYMSLSAIGGWRLNCGERCSVDLTFNYGCAFDGVFHAGPRGATIINLNINKFMIGLTGEIIQCHYDYRGVGLVLGYRF